MAASAVLIPEPGLAVVVLVDNLGGATLLVELDMAVVVLVVTPPLLRWSNSFLSFNNSNELFGTSSVLRLFTGLMSGLDDVTTFVVLSRDICDAVDLEVDDREDREDRDGGVVVEVIGPELVPSVKGEHEVSVEEPIDWLKIIQAKNWS